MNDELPKAFPTGSALHVGYSTALLARATGTLGAIVTLSELERRSDVMTLLRSLYEHVALMAWLSTPPEDEHGAAWVRYDSERRLKADDDFTESEGPILTPQNREAAQRLVQASETAHDLLVSRPLSINVAKRKRKRPPDGHGPQRRGRPNDERRGCPS